jgi:hypothetical protein
MPLRLWTVAAMLRMALQAGLCGKLIPCSLLRLLRGQLGLDDRSQVGGDHPCKQECALGVIVTSIEVNLRVGLAKRAGEVGKRK